MPIYDFRCGKCQKVHEVYRSLADCYDGPKCCGNETERYYSGDYRIAPDIEPYVTAAADKQTGKRVRIGSRSEHRDFLKRNNYIEVGNEATPFYKGKREFEHG